MLISIISPIYKGNKYIDALINIAENNWTSLNQEFDCGIELVLVNDYPQEELIVNQSLMKNVKIRAIQSKINRGIHGARVLGLKQSKGDYVLFLDQDDYIVDDCILSQMKQLGNADAIICNGRNGIYGRHFIYSGEEAQRKTADLMYYLKYDNPIVSPGQVLIKKSSIPGEWVKNILKKNGADDYYLWILMLLQGRKLQMNTHKLYMHTIHRENASADKSAMSASRREMFQLLRRKSHLTLMEYYYIWKLSFFG